MTFIARNFEPDPYDVREFTLRLYQDCLEATGSAESGHSVALDLVKAIAISAKDPKRGAKPDRKYVLELFEECLQLVHGEGSEEASAARSAGSTDQRPSSTHQSPSATDQNPSSTGRRSDDYPLDRLRARSRTR
jgi:hypothetical protein